MRGSPVTSRRKVRPAVRIMVWIYIIAVAAAMLCMYLGLIRFAIVGSVVCGVLLLAGAAYGLIRRRKDIEAMDDPK